MMKRLLLMVLALVCLCPAALAGGKEPGNLKAQEGLYSPEYSLVSSFAVPVGETFEFVLYQDGGELPMTAERNGGAVPAGMAIYQRIDADTGLRQVYIRGSVLAEGDYSFGVLIREWADEEGCALALLQVTLRVSDDVQTVDKYLGDGRGMLRVLVDGVNFRRTPGGKRLGVYDKGERFVWCSTTEKGGYTWYRVWSEEHGYGYLRGDMVQEDAPLRLVYTPGKETAFTLFITSGETDPLTPALIMTEAPEEIGFDTDSLVNVIRGGDTWTLLCFCIEEKKSFWIQVDLRDEFGVPLECQLVYLTTEWTEPPEYVFQ